MRGGIYCSGMWDNTHLFKSFSMHGVCDVTVIMIKAQCNTLKNRKVKLIRVCLKRGVPVKYMFADYY